MNYIALKNRFSVPLLSDLVLISSSFRSRSKTKNINAESELETFSLSLKVGSIWWVNRGIIRNFACYVMSFWPYLFVLFCFSFFVCRNSWTHYHIICYFCLFRLKYYSLTFILFFKLTRLQVGAILVRFLTINHMNQNCKRAMDYGICVLIYMQ